MQVRIAKAIVAIAIALVLNHARCVAACIADPCTQVQQPRCHQHKSSEAKVDRGCAFPAALDAQGIAIVQVAAEAPEPSVAAPMAVAVCSTPLVADVRGGPPGAALISVLRI